ncbi:hypothetical protein L2E82_29031 [Cichorium intybus]|uniref:Uncharacterized protein n=1 Tax=Cichorium intybus TaxID=13427 RepID=A0ACB9CX05_CICIN|nr:hypothetical protein L2E82_29031 [Cichorium intybus]
MDLQIWTVNILHLNPIYNPPFPYSSSCLTHPSLRASKIRFTNSHPPWLSSSRKLPPAVSTKSRTCPWPTSVAWNSN